MRTHVYLAAIVLAGIVCVSARAEDASDIRELKLKDWAPRSMMVTKSTAVPKPRFPVIDDHNHLGTGKEKLTPEVVRHYLTEMDEAGVRTVVNLDGMWGDRLKETLAALDEAHPGRFLTFAQVNFQAIDDADWSRREAERLEASFRAGAKGLKIHKTLGLGHRHKDGRLIRVDDPKLSAIFEVCAKYRRPVMIHTADPKAFFTPLDRFNERWHELNQHPDWLFYGKDFPSQQELLDQFIRVVARHPQTTFIGAHFGNNAEDVATVAKWLDEHPNLVIDIDARISELGRQPYTTRKFLVKYQDRVMFGTDTPPARTAYRNYYRFLETDDEYIDCSVGHHLQGFWMIYGVYLPADVLEKIYYKNAERLLYFGQSGKAATTETGRSADGAASQAAGKVTIVKQTEDFRVTGDGAAPAWQKASWVSLEKRPGGKAPYQARFKVLYSPKGLYVLLSGTDRKITASLQEDFANLYEEDVFEFFLWPDERHTTYFEYEISPLGRELPILVPQMDKQYYGWRPWHYEGARMVQKAVVVSGGAAKWGDEISGWKAEVFVPFDLLKPLAAVPPRPQSRWRANFYRIDYDDGPANHWYWSRVGPTFHDIQNFGTLVFE